MRTDLEIQRDVQHELLWDSRVEAAGIGVSVENGIVMLSGSVKSYAEKVAAKDAAHYVAGVLDVANEIEVIPASGKLRSDTDIAAAIRHTLEWDVLVPEERIQSTVSKGWVTLEGNVNTWQQRTDAERAIRHLYGVRGVTNLIAVEPETVDSSTIHAAIEEALERRAKREAKRIHIEVNGGIATLTGTVATPEERRAIAGAASQTPGVMSVIDLLEIAKG